MSIPLLDYTTSSRNHRVNSFEVPGDEYPRIFTTDNLSSNNDFEILIQAAYRQLFNEQQMLASTRQRNLESQLKAQHITVRDFIQGLATSDSFRRLVYDANDNYRFVQICIQRILGRDVYNEREKLAWSIVLVSEGLSGFIHSLVDSQEYLDAFGDNTVPYQRRRILPQRSRGEISFAHTPRYGKEHLAQLTLMGNDFSATDRNGIQPDYNWRPPQSVRQIGAILTYGLAGFFSLIILAVILSWFGLFSI
jgi:phycobilisome rod-core linker protein